MADDALASCVESYQQPRYFPVHDKRVIVIDGKSFNYMCHRRVQDWSKMPNTKGNALYICIVIRLIPDDVFLFYDNANQVQMCGLDYKCVYAKYFSLQDVF